MPKEIRVKKEELLSVVKENMEAHKLVYEKSMIMFKENYGHRLSIMTAGIEIGEFDMHLNLSKPESHEKDYQRIIRMLELECREELELDEQEFAHYVMDQWGWFYTFRTSYYSNSSYYSSSSSSSSNSSSSTDSSKHGKCVSDEEAERIKRYLEKQS
jgi:hypothetical protein